MSIVLILLPLATKAHECQSEHDPRRSLINRDDIINNKFALIGDSVFCSYYVNNDRDAIWNKFESITGCKIFPGALDGAKKGDLVNAAKYISVEMPANSTIFIDIIPTRCVSDESDVKNNYDQQFASLFQKEDSIFYSHVRYLDVNYLDFMARFLSKRKSDLDVKEQYNRRWNINGDFALNRYKGFENTKINTTSIDNMKFISDINEIVSKKKIREVFVLTPLNKKEIFTYSDKNDADRIYEKLNKLHSETLKYLHSMNAPYIDLFNAVPDGCFADLVHTNACGDEIIAKALADYASNAK